MALRAESAMNNLFLNEVRNEIESLHQFFCGWFNGQLPEEEFDSQFLSRFSPDLVFIPPAGNLLGLDDLSASVRAGYASNHDFRIQIRNVTVQHEFDGHIIATYEEWQRNALASKPTNNGRIASVVFTTGQSLKWLHIHETWLPEEIMDADSYDF